MNASLSQPAATGPGVVREGPRGAPSWSPFLVFCCVCGLTVAGLAVMFSASRAMDVTGFGLLKKQLVWLGLALVGGAAATVVPLDRLRRYWWLVALVSVALLVLVLVAGIRVNGAQRWLGWGPVRMQVAEFAKVGLVLALAAWLSGHQRRVVRFWEGFAAPCAMIGVWCGLILLQPDFGTAFLCGCVGLMLVYQAGARHLYLIPSALVALAGFALAVFKDPVRWRRITAYLDLEGNREGSAYQLWQGLLGFGSGGWTGVGLGNGRQQLRFLPEAHTDFIFSVVGEELGLVATGGIVLLFVVIFVLTTLHLRRAPNLFQFLLVQGALLFITFQALINFGVVTGLLPTKGMSLPFISYGGSNLVVMFLFTGLILNAFRSWEKPLHREPSEW